MPERYASLKNAIRAVVPRSVRNSLRSPSRSAAWLWDSAAFSLGQTKSIELAPGWQLVCHPHFYKVVHSAQLADPEQSEEFRNFLARCSENMFLFDIGAHFGVFSLAAAHRGGRAVAVDPSPTATDMIAIETKLNRCTDRVRILQAAVSDAAGEMSLLSSGTFSEGYFKVAQGRLESDLTKTLAVTVNQMAAEFGAPTHIKIDVEGHEASVLKGARSLLEEKSPFLFLELHNDMISEEGGDPAEALNILDSLGYRIRGLDGDAMTSKGILRLPIVRVTAEREGSLAS
jgi:FkbM family methyltransferase